MKDKKYIDCLVITNTGTSFPNPLKLSEVALISKLLQENKKITATIKTVSVKEYHIIFG